MDGPDTLHAWQREGPLHHRALLLWVLVTPGTEGRGTLRKSSSAVARALQIDRNKISRYMRERRWVARIKGHKRLTGVPAEEAAATLYRSLYGRKYGSTELPEMAAFVLPTLLKMAAGREPPAAGATDATEAAADLIEKLTPEAPYAEAEEIEAIQEAVDAARASKLDLNRAFTNTVKRLLRNFGEALQGKEGVDKPAAKVSDLGKLYELLKQLADDQIQLDSPANPAVVNGDRQVEDTARVRIAKQQGRSVLRAIREDVRELGVVLDALAASEDQQAVELELLEGGQPAEEAM